MASAVVLSLISFCTCLLLLLLTVPGFSDCSNPPANGHQPLPIQFAIETRDEKDNKVDINEFLMGVIQNFKEDMPHGVPDLKVPILDPYEAPKPFKLDVVQDKVDVHANFSNIQVGGLSNFELEYLDANLTQLTLRFQLRLTKIRATGVYFLNGMIIKIVPLRGNGGFWVESDNVTLNATASMVQMEETDGSLRLQLHDDFDVHIDFDTVHLDLENFLGGGRWTEILKRIINDLSKRIFTKFLPELKGELNKSLLKVINKQLLKLPLTVIMPGSSADDYVDEILFNVRKFINDNNYDPMELPDYSSNFSKEVLFMTVYGEAKLYDGWLSGISTLHRTHHCSIDANRTTISILANLGLNNLRLTYKGKAHFMKMGPSIECGGSIEEVSFYFSVEQSNRKGSKPLIREIEVVNMTTIWIEMSGLGPLSWIMKWLLTGLTKLIDGFIVEKVTSSLHEYLQGELENYPFPI